MILAQDLDSQEQFSSRKAGGWWFLWSATDGPSLVGMLLV